MTIMSARKAAVSSTHPSPISPDTMGFEEAMTELDSLILAVENNRLPLEETLQSYQRGQQLIARCTELLRDAEQRIQLFEDGRPEDSGTTEQA